jgi:hypothetical protein
MAKDAKVDPRTNEIVTEIRFPPNARVLDHRGEWATILSEELDLKEWAIDENTVKLTNAAASRFVSVGFQNAVVMARDVETKNFFPDFAGKVIRKLFSFENFGPLILVRRLGVRSKYCTQFKGDFSELVRLLAQHYVAPTHSVVKTFGPSAKLVDIGAPLNFEDEQDFFNTNCGPMKRGQLRQFFQKNEGFPDVALYFEIDYFSRPDAKLKADDVIRDVSRFATRSWEFNERVRDAVIKG